MGRVTRPGRALGRARDVVVVFVRAVLLVLSVAASPVFPSRSLHAQLRPLDPLDHGVYEPGTGVIVEVGAGVYDGQRASLAGTEGRLLEFGQLHVLWRWDRVAFEAAGTVLRRFDDRAVFSAPVPGTREVDGARRQDAGDFRLATVVTLWARPAGAVVLRFGTRLPTTDNETGLERDRTDFFALVAAGWRLGPVQVAAESGVGIHGTRDDGMEQVDVWLYALSVGYRWGTVVPGVAFVGQADGLSGDSLRGNEDLREVRFGLRVGERRWLRVGVVRGVTAIGPEVGVSFTLGASF